MVLLLPMQLPEPLQLIPRPLARGTAARALRTVAVVKCMFVYGYSEIKAFWWVMSSRMKGWCDAHVIGGGRPFFIHGSSVPSSHLWVNRLTGWNTVCSLVFAH